MELLKEKGQELKVQVQFNKLEHLMDKWLKEEQCSHFPEEKLSFRIKTDSLLTWILFHLKL